MFGFKSEVLMLHLHQAARQQSPRDANLLSDSDFDVSTLSIASKQFQFWQLESLADQAADLLEPLARATVDRARDASGVDRGVATTPAAKVAA